MLVGATEQKDYWSRTHELEEVSDYWIGAKRHYFQSALQTLASLTDGRRLLDVGGGVGFFSESAIERGWDAYSLDISSQATARAAERIGSERALSDVAQVEDHTFDVASLWCVVAHTRQPGELIASVARKLRRGGIVWITTPNFDFQRRYAGARLLLRRPINFAAEDHVGHFTWSALTRLLIAHGFTPPTLHFAGVTETCLLTSSRNRLLIEAKRYYNRAAFALARRGVGPYISELQASARLVAPV